MDHIIHRVWPAPKIPQKNTEAVQCVLFISTLHYRPPIILFFPPQTLLMKQISEGTAHQENVNLGSLQSEKPWCYFPRNLTLSLKHEEHLSPK